MNGRERLLSDQVRKSPRLRNWDYRSPGLYFVTIVTWDRGDLFGQVAAASVHLNAIGRIVESEWLRTSEVRSNVEIDEFVVMPNHFHAIVRITTEIPRGGQLPAPNDGVGIGDSLNHSLSSVVRGFKATTTRQINQLRELPGQAVWHRSFHDSIIRSEQHLSAVRAYIRNNPRNWLADPNRQPGAEGTKATGRTGGLRPTHGP